MAALVSKDFGGLDRVGINWVHRFLKRHPEIHTKVGVKVIPRGFGIPLLKP
jgi:hypothetical protein